MKKGKVAGKDMVVVDAVKGTQYAWCSCGLSGSQPFCNGAHAGTEFTPKVFSEDKDKKIGLCTCKQTSTPPYCDGSHSQL